MRCPATGTCSHFHGLGAPASDVNACCQPACHICARRQPVAHCRTWRPGGSWTHVAGQPAVHSDCIGYGNVHTIAHADRFSFAHCHRIDRRCHSYPSAECADGNTRSTSGDSRAHVASTAHAHPCAHSDACADHPAGPGHGVGERRVSHSGRRRDGIWSPPRQWSAGGRCRDGGTLALEGPLRGLRGRYWP
jgi:hypothetical protein